MKVLLVCSGGMSSAMVVKSLINEGKKSGLEIDSKAVGSSEFSDEIVKGWDAALVAPQIRHKFKEFESISREAGVPIDVIEARGYSPLGGKFLIAQTKKLLGL